MNKTEVLKLNDEVIAAWNMHNEERLMGLCDENSVWKVNGGQETFRGKREIRDYFNRWNSAFPDLNIKIRTKTATEDTVVVEYEFSGTNNGTLNLRKDLPQISPTHKTYRNNGCYISKIKNGKIAETSLYTDRLALIEQLGVESELMHHHA